MGLLSELLRLVKITGLKDGQIQSGRVEAHEAKSHAAARRWQDYGFAAHPVDGQGLAIEVAGHTIILRMDRLNEKPALQEFDVAIWHKEGHLVRLGAGKKVTVENAAEVTVQASTRVLLDTPLVQMTGALEVGQDILVDGHSILHHDHPGVQNGSDRSGPMT